MREVLSYALNNTKTILLLPHYCRYHQEHNLTVEWTGITLIGPDNGRSRVVKLYLLHPSRVQRLGLCVWGHIRRDNSTGLTLVCRQVRQPGITWLIGLTGGGRQTIGYQWLISDYARDDSAVLRRDNVTRKPLFDLCLRWHHIMPIYQTWRGWVVGLLAVCQIVMSVKQFWRNWYFGWPFHCIVICHVSEDVNISSSSPTDQLHKYRLSHDIGQPPLVTRQLLKLHLLLIWNNIRCILKR